MSKQTLKEKIKLSEELVDKYLDEDIATGIMATTALINVGQSVANDAKNVAKWAQKKMAERKQKQMLAKQEKEMTNKKRNIA